MKNDSARDKAMDKLVEAKLRSGLNPGRPNCLDAEILAAYVERTLTSRERAHCELHLASCANCQAHVAALVRLNEADEPAGIQTKTAASAPAAGISWFHWAWAGPALAAMLVMGIYFGGPFRENIRQIQEPTSKIQNPVAPKPANPSPPREETTNGVQLRAASGSVRTQKSQHAENKTLDMERHAGATTGGPGGPQAEPPNAGVVGGITARKEPANRGRNQVVAQDQPSKAPAAPPPPAYATDQVAPAREGSIAPPSVRSDLAKKDGRGQNTGTTGGIISGGAAGIASRTAPANPPASQSKDDLQNGGRNAQAVSPQPGQQTTNEKIRSMKSGVYDHQAKAKKEAQTNDADRAGLPENERDKKQSTESVSVSSATEQVMVTSSETAPVWRVGRHGRIEKLDANGKWKKQKSGVHANLFAVAFPSPEVGWAVGQGGTVLRTTDGGTTWSQLAIPTTEDLVQVNSNSGQAASVRTRSGLTFNTIDGGATWRTAGH